MSQAVVPEIALDTAAAAAIATTTSNRITTSGTEGKFTLRPPLTESTEYSEDSNDIHSRLRRPLRNIPPIKSDSAMFNRSRSLSYSRPASNSAYPTPDRSDTSKDLKTNIRSNGRKLHTKASISKLVSPSPSASPYPPMIYDTIEVMLAPPPELLAGEPKLTKRRTSKGVGRRSKRRKLDTEDGRGLFESDEAVATDSARQLCVEDGLEETESIVVPGPDDTRAEEIQIENLEPREPDTSQEPGEENQNQETVSTIVLADTTPSPTPNQTQTQPEEYINATPVNVESPKLSLPLTPEPAHESISAPASIAKSHQSEDVDDWLMTDIDQSVDEPILHSDPMLEDVSYGKDDAEDNKKSEDTDREIACDPIAPDEPHLPFEKVVSSESPVTAIAIDDLMDRTHEDTRDTRDESVMELDVGLHEDTRDTRDESVMELDVGLHDDATLDGDAITTLIDEARMSLSGSAVESPSPPLRTILLPRRPFSAGTLGTSKSSPSKESFQPNELESGETSDDFARQRPLLHDLPISKHPLISLYPKFDSQNMRSRRSARRANEAIVELRRRPIPMELPLSTDLSGASSLSSPRSLPTPPAASPPPVSRAVSPSFGLRTTPRPIGRPPLYPARGGLRHVNHDTDVRAKLLMARPKIAIPPHIDTSVYARECLEAAVFCRLPPYNLDPSEHQLLRTHINHVQVTTYLNVRNGILRLWMLNPTIAVCREEALGVAKEERHLEMAAKCHEFLVRYGYINFGCILPPRPLSRPAEELPKEKSLRRRKRVVIVGAGAAGLGCARQLEGLFVQFADRFPRNDELPEVIVLEGRDRIGGRIHSHSLVSPSMPERPKSALRLNSKSSSLSASSMSRVSTSSFATASLQRVADPAVDLGAQIVTGFDNGNPLAPIVKRQLQLRWQHVHDDSLLFNDQDGVRVNRMEDIRSEKLFNDILDRASAFKEKIKDPPLIEGDRELMDQGKEPHGESGRQIAKVEENEAVLPPMPPSPPLSATRDTPFSSRPSPNPHSQKARIPVRQALTRMGFKLKDGEFNQKSLDPNELSSHTTLGDTMKSILVDMQRFVDLSPMDLKLLNWHWANLEYGNATNLNKLSLKHWDQDDGNEFLGAHAMIIGGYGQFVKGLASTPSVLDVRYDQCVNKITYSRSQNRRTPDFYESLVTIVCDNGQSIQADAVVLTPSLGVLKSGSITFDPELPVHKRDAISRLGFGLLNKVVLVYEHPFWDAEADVIGSLRTPEKGDLGVQDSYENCRGRFYLIWNCTPSCGRPTLVALMAGEAAFQVENEPDESLVSEMTSILSRIYHKESLPPPIQYMVSRWYQDPFARGSYSFVGPNATGKDYDILGESVDQKLFFAGEATCRTHPATVHGAYMSGLRAATEVLESFIGKIEMPPDEVLIPKRYQPVRNPLVEKSSVLQVRRRTDPESHRFKAKSIKRSRFAKIVEECSQRILAELGPKPVPPKKFHPNAFLLFQKDKWVTARDNANKAKAGSNSDGGELASRDEIRATMGQMWRHLPDDEKRYYNEAVEREKLLYKEEISSFTGRLEAWESAVAKIKEEMKGKLDEVDLTEEEREMVLAAREEELLEIAANEEKEKLKQFFGEIGMDDLDDLFPDQEEERIEDLYLQSDDAILDQLLRRLG